MIDDFLAINAGIERTQNNASTQTVRKCRGKKQPETDSILLKGKRHPVFNGES